QTFNLLDVEDGIALQVVNLAVNGVACLGIRLAARKAVRIDHRRAFLALADMRLELDRLLVSHPDRGGKALRGRRSPERKHVDAGIGLAGVAERPRDAPCGMLGVPRPRPGPRALFERGDDARRDAGVDVLPWFVAVLHCPVLLAPGGFPNAQVPDR